jgi:thioredoxin-related protein
MRWLFLLLALVSVASAAEVRDPSVHFFQPKFGNFQEELGTASQEGKKGVLIMFEMDDCPFCQRMKATVLNQSEVQDYFRRNFLIYRVNTQSDAPMTDFSGKQTTEKAFSLVQRARATPVFIFYGLDGKPMVRYTGVTKGVKEFLLLGRYVVEGVYKTLPFDVYKRRHADR